MSTHASREKFVHDASSPAVVIVRTPPDRGDTPQIPGYVGQDLPQRFQSGRERHHQVLGRAGIIPSKPLRFASRLQPRIFVKVQAVEFPPLEILAARNIRYTLLDAFNPALISPIAPVVDLTWFSISPLSRFFFFFPVSPSPVCRVTARESSGSTALRSPVCRSSPKLRRKSWRGIRSEGKGTAAAAAAEATVCIMGAAVEGHGACKSCFHVPPAPSPNTATVTRRFFLFSR